MKDFFKKIFGQQDSNATPDKKENERAKEVPQQSNDAPPAKKEPRSFSFLESDYALNQKWIELFSHFILLEAHNKMPSKQWYKELAPLIDTIGREDYIRTGTKWINDCIQKSKENSIRFKQIGAVAAKESIEASISDKNKTPEWVRKVYGAELNNGSFFDMQNQVYLNNFQYYFYHSLGGRILRGFLHSTVLLPDNDLIALVDTIALTSPNTSQDAIHVYSKMPKDIGVPKLTYLRSKVKNRNILSRINKGLQAIGKREGLTQAEIEESIIPDHGINEKGQFIKKISNYSAVYETSNIKSFRTFYLLENGKEQKTLPKYLKENHASAVRDFKRSCKEIKSALTAQRNRIEHFYLTDRSIPFLTFQKNYFDNHLVKIIAKDLIWNFQNDTQNVNLIFRNEAFQTLEGKRFDEDLSKYSVKLWHPIGFEADYILQWRQYLLDHEILQAFKQGFREVYIITDAEIETASYSNRYASHILNKDHVSALCKVRGWSPSGIINSGKATYRIPGTDFKVEYWVSDVYLGEHSKTYGSAHISTDQVRFFRKRTQLELVDVPAMIFSEVMRDIDLFVGVTSIGNDPTWHDRGDQNSQSYWSTYSFGDLSERSKSRSEILKNIVPKMKIAKVCSFDGKYLKVQGKIRSYKIHMGSGNILMEPNDQYLCIVQDRSPAALKKVFIPFEGDNLLSIIISKAILLANDDKTKDPTILRQINRK